MAQRTIARSLAVSAVAVAWLFAALAAAHADAPRDGGADPLVYAGVVLDDAGKPLSGATLYVNYPTADQFAFLRGTWSGADGRFRFEVARAAFDKSRQDNPWMYAAVVATADGFGPVWMSAATPPLIGTQPADRLTLRLARDDVPIEGRIVDVEGRSVAGARIQPFLLQYRQNRELVHVPWDSNESGPGTMGSNISVKNFFPEVATGADGRFTIKGIGRDRMIQVGVSGPNIVSQSLELETRPGPMRTLEGFGLVRNGKAPARRTRYGARFEHTAEPSRAVVGVVRERGSDRPIAGARVNFNTPTDAQGRFRLEGMPRTEEYKLSILPPEGRPYFPAEKTIMANRFAPQPVTANLELTKGVLLRGRVTDSQTGRPIRGFLTYIPLKGNRHIDDLPPRQFSTRREAVGATDAEGRFSFAVAPGPGVVVVRAGTGDNVWYPPVRRVSDADRARGLGYPGDDALIDTVPRLTDLSRFNAYRVVEIPERGVEVFDCDFLIDPGATRGGPIVDPDGNPLERVMVYGLRDPVFDSWGQLSDREYSVRNLESGVTRRVFFFHEARKLGAHRDLRSDVPGPIPVRLRPCGSITGRVVDAEGAPVAAVRFRLLYEDAQGSARVLFPPGSPVRTEAEVKRDSVVSGFNESQRPTIAETSDKEGRFRIENVIPATRFHLVAVPSRGAEKPIADTAIVPGHTAELGDVSLDGEPAGR